ncbi:Lrp/AsnC family transcriptional regulator [Paradevosia shaoguanensis]|uniref:Lrp/AsnC family transcriptional regulator n=1 Tax=Paradevosia shaoguanensis TaxID=1335043 RepID=UPI001931E2FC|nr:Lrp/AsnC family transcriptional regulator [Paradevosia shaoguanensis]
MSADFDQTDLDIVVELSKDGRCPFREIARKLGISEGTVRMRVARLQEKGYIRIAAVGRPSALGIACNAMVLLKVPPQSVRHAAALLAERHHVRFVGVTMGSSDIVIQTLHNSFQELFDFVSRQLLEIVPDLISSETLQFGEVLKSEWNWAEWFRNGLAATPGAEPSGRKVTETGDDASGAGDADGNQKEAP